MVQGRRDLGRGLQEGQRLQRASSWTHKASTSKSINETLSSLTASTKYNIKLYVLFNGEYQYGSAIDVTTSAAE